MKYLFTLTLVLSNLAYANIMPIDTTPPKIKLTCINVYNADLKKEVKRCKPIKQHKKYEGKPVL